MGLFFLSRVNYLYRTAFKTLTLGVRAAVISESDGVFLVRHTYTRGWHLPGGGIEKNESAEDALRRELREEAGIALTGPPLLHGIFFNSDASVRDHVLVYVVRQFELTRTKEPNLEIAAARFFPLSALPDDVAPSSGRRLREILFDVDRELTW